MTRSKMNTPWHTTEARSKHTPSARALAGETYYTVHVSAANMPSSCWGRYCNVAVLECEVGHEPKAIRDTAKVRVICGWYKQHVGTTPRSASEKALDSAHLIVARLTSQIALARSIPSEPARDLSRVAARTCAVSGTVSHA